MLWTSQGDLIRTTNLIGSTFATVRLRTKKTTGAGRSHNRIWCLEDWRRAAYLVDLLFTGCVATLADDGW